MRTTVPEKLEAGRIKTGRMASDQSYGFYGAFEIGGPCGATLTIITCRGADKITEGWEHVSVSTRSRPPNWQEMCFVKELCWNDDECVVQFHPPKADHVNNHPHCLHLWKPTKCELPMPPAILVGVKSLGTLTSDKMNPAMMRG